MAAHTRPAGRPRHRRRTAIGVASLVTPDLGLELGQASTLSHCHPKDHRAHDHKYRQQGDAPGDPAAQMKNQKYKRSQAQHGAGKRQIET